MDDSQLLRYSRHILLPEIDVDGQQKLLDAHVVIIGAGGLGSPAALYLASAGVGRITLVDHDTVDLTNLQRQIAHTELRVGMEKTLSVRQALQQVNSSINIRALHQRADTALLNALAAEADVMLDCTDNFATRQLVNQACVAQGTHLVWGAAIRFQAQLGVRAAHDADSPCYACTFDPAHPPEEERCATMGVFAPIVGIIGCIQAAEALKLLLGMHDSELHRAMLLVDALRMSFMPIGLQRRPTCPVCAAEMPQAVGKV